MTKDITKKLYEAINKAKEPGACRYVIGQTPGCVVGQFCHLMGVPLAAMRWWDRGCDSVSNKPINRWTTTSVTVSQVVGHDPVAAEAIPKEVRNLLRELQSMWDMDLNEHEGAVDRLRDAMRKHVDEYTGG